VKFGEVEVEIMEGLEMVGPPAARASIEIAAVASLAPALLS